MPIPVATRLFPRGVFVKGEESYAMVMRAVVV